MVVGLYFGREALLKISRGRLISGSDMARTAHGCAAGCTWGLDARLRRVFAGIAVLGWLAGGRPVVLPRR